MGSLPYYVCSMILIRTAGNSLTTGKMIYTFTMFQSFGHLNKMGVIISAFLAVTSALTSRGSEHLLLSLKLEA
jgi:hypothetical protein